MAKLVSMKMSKSEREEQSKPTMLGDAPIYPYGLQLRLDEDALGKLGETTLPAVGESVMVYAKAKVVSVSSNESTDGGKRRNVELQITDLCLEDPGDDATAERLYGKAK